WARSVWDEGRNRGVSTAGVGCTTPTTPAAPPDPPLPGPPERSTPPASPSAGWPPPRPPNSAPPERMRPGPPAAGSSPPTPSPGPGAGPCSAAPPSAACSPPAGRPRPGRSTGSPSASGPAPQILEERLSLVLREPLEADRPGHPPVVQRHPPELVHLCPLSSTAIASKSSACCPLSSMGQSQPKPPQPVFRSW